MIYVSKYFSLTEFNDLFIVGRFKFMTIPTFTKIREPITNSRIIQLHISDDDDIYLVTDCGLVFKSNDFRNIMDLRFDELKIPNVTEKVVKIAPGTNFVSILTDDGRCYSLLNDEKDLIESGKLKNLLVVDIKAGAQHVLVSAMTRNEDVNGNQEPMLNQTYTINFQPIKGLGNGEENYQEPDTGENLRARMTRIKSEEAMNYDNGDKLSVIELEDTLCNGSGTTTLECSGSSGKSSDQGHSPNPSDSTIRFIDNGFDKSMILPEGKLICLHGDEPVMKVRTNSVRINVDEDEDYEHKSIERTKTPMPRSRKVKVTNEDLDENGIIDRDEDLYNDDDDVSTSTMHGSDDSLEQYIKEENKINDEKTNGFLPNKKIKKLKQFVSDIKDKGKGLSCKNADNVIDEHEANLNDTLYHSKDNSKSCAIM